MNKKCDVAAIGTQDTIALFNAVGIQSLIATSPEDADKKIFQLVQEKCKIIYIVEELYEAIGKTLEKYKNQPFPMIIPIPTGVESKGIGLKKIKSNVEKAIGIDIF